MYSVRGAQIGNLAYSPSATQFWNWIRRSHEYPSDSIAGGVEQAENFVGFFYAPEMPFATNTE